MRLQRKQAGSNGRFQRTDVEDHSRRSPQSEVAQQRVRDAQRRGENNEVVFQVRLAPIVDPHHPTGRPGGVGDFHREALRDQKLNEPTAHLAAAADDQRSATGSRSARHHTGALLGSQGRADQESQQVFRQRWRHAQLRGRGPNAHDHFTLTFIVAGRVARGALGTRNLAAYRLALRHQCEQLAIDLIQPFAQVFQRRFVAGHVNSRPRVMNYPSIGAA